jgi:hypothetical protein
MSKNLVAMLRTAEEAAVRYLRATPLREFYMDPDSFMEGIFTK